MAADAVGRGVRAIDGRGDAEFRVRAVFERPLRNVEGDRGRHAPWRSHDVVSSRSPSTNEASSPLIG
jgi:hypothetical protein